MKKILGAASAALVFGAAGAVWYASSRRQSDAFLTREVTQDFDAKSVLPAPKAAPGARATPRALAPTAASKKPWITTVKPGGAPKAPAPSGPFVELLKAPARYLVDKTALGRPDRLKAFLADPKRVGRYVNHPIVRRVLDSKSAVLLALRPALVEAFVQSPAMKDPAAVSALGRSELLKQVLNSAGVRQALQDPAALQTVLGDPKVMAWLASNPSAVASLQQAVPGLAQAMLRR